MKRLFAIILLAACSAASAQTIKTLGYNTTNGEVVYSGTNTLTFTNAVFFTNAQAAYIEAPNFFVSDGTNGIVFETTTVAAITRTNLGLYATNAQPVTFASGLWDGLNGAEGLRVLDGELAIIEQAVITNAPVDTTNAAAWIIINSGTNSYKLPLYQ